MVVTLVDILAPHDGFGVGVCSGVPLGRHVWGGASGQVKFKGEDGAREGRRYEGKRKMTGVKPVATKA
jgi:hypothetical protein